MQPALAGVPSTRGRRRPAVPRKPVVGAATRCATDRNCVRSRPTDGALTRLRLRGALLRTRRGTTQSTPQPPIPPSCKNVCGIRTGVRQQNLISLLVLKKSFVGCGCETIVPKLSRAWLAQCVVVSAMARVGIRVSARSLPIAIVARKAVYQMQRNLLFATCKCNSSTPCIWARTSACSPSIVTTCNHVARNSA